MPMQPMQPIPLAPPIKRDDERPRAPSGSTPSTVNPSRASNASLDGLNGSSAAPVAGPGDASLISPWKAFATACQDTIRDLAQVYLEIVYPMFVGPSISLNANDARFPLFHWPSFSRAIENLDYLHDEGFFASTMAMCALASARARDGALYTARWTPQQLASPPSEVFWTAAKESIPRDLATAKGTEYMRACAILSIASIQHGQIQGMQQYLGTYHTLATMDGLQDEKFWPKDLDPIVVEIRRRMVSSVNL